MFVETNYIYSITEIIAQFAIFQGRLYVCENVRLLGLKEEHDPRDRPHKNY